MNCVCYKYLGETSRRHLSLSQNPKLTSEESYTSPFVYSECEDYIDVVLKVSVLLCSVVVVSS